MKAETKTVKARLKRQPDTRRFHLSSHAGMGLQSQGEKPVQNVLHLRMYEKVRGEASRERAEEDGKRIPTGRKP